MARGKEREPPHCPLALKGEQSEQDQRVRGGSSDAEAIYLRSVGEDPGCRACWECHRGAWTPDTERKNLTGGHGTKEGLQGPPLDKMTMCPLFCPAQKGLGAGARAEAARA